MARTFAHEFRATDDQIQRRLDRRRSGAAGKHGDRRTKRLRTRSAVRRAAVSQREW